jgi:hypothetical protein
MSYGYIIASNKAATNLEKSRRYRFEKIHSHAGINYYLRLEEGGALTVRQGNTSLLTAEGASFFNSLDGTFYFMDFLMAHHEGDTDVLKKMQDAIKGCNVKKITLVSGACLDVNKVYRVHS